MEPTEKTSLLDRVRRNIYSKLPSQLKSAVDEGLSYAAMPTDDLKRLRRLILDVGVRTPKDLLELGTPEPKNNLEKYIYLKAAEKKTPAELARFIARVSVTNTQEDMAAALEVTPEKLHTLLPRRSKEEIRSAAFKLFTTKTFMNVLNNILYYGFFSHLAIVRSLLGDMVDVGGFVGKIVEKVLFSIKNSILYTIFTFIPLVFKTLNKKFISPIGSMLTGMVSSALLLGSKAKGQVEDIIDGISEKVGDKIPELVSMDKTGSEVVPDKEEVSRGVIEGLVQAVQMTAMDISKYFTANSLGAMREMAAEVGVSTFQSISDLEDVSPSTPLEKRIFAEFKKLGTPDRQVLFISKIYRAETEDQLGQILGISSVDEMSIYFPSRGRRMLKTLGYFSVAFLLGLGLVALTSSLGGVGALTAKLMGFMQPALKFLAGYLGVAGVAIFLKAMIAKAVLSGVIGTTIKFYLTQGPKKVRYVVHALTEWVKRSIKSFFSDLLGKFRRNKSASMMQTGAMMFEVIAHLEPRKWDKAHCESKTCDEMGFSEKASCRPYKNCYTKTSAKRDDPKLKNTGKGGLSTWFAGHGGGDPEDRATWGDWVAITPVKHTIKKEDGGDKTYEPGDIVGPCAVSSEKEWASVTGNGSKPLKCMPREKAWGMPKEDRAALARKKKTEEAKHKGKKPVNTPTFSSDAAKVTR